MGVRASCEVAALGCSLLLSTPITSRRDQNLVNQGTSKSHRKFFSTVETRTSDQKKP